ncbi:MAG: hypothetical protein Q4Q18_07890 [Methanobrevibacter sp.]|nr:hypothetical protein [Methanobrevibacter sp.]
MSRSQSFWAIPLLVPTPCTKQLIDVYSTYNASAIFTRGGSHR